MTSTVVAAVAGSSTPSPLSAVVIGCAPAVANVVTHCARPPETGTAAHPGTATPPSRNATVPVAEPGPMPAVSTTAATPTPALPEVVRDTDDAPRVAHPVTARQTSSRPPVTVRPASAGTRSTAPSSRASSWAVVSVGSAESTSAAAPLTCGAAIEVPLR